MCGIWALITKSKFNTQKLEAFEQVKPRGPDHTILHLNASSIIGFHRLAINDLSSKGQQPFCESNQDYKYTVIANGEIYNHQKLRKSYELEIDSRSDCAVILPLFRKLGDDFKALNLALHGEYAIFVTRQEIKTGNVDYWLSTDPLSVRPAFYFSAEHQFGVSSLLAGLASLNQEVKRLDQGTLIHGRFIANNNFNQIILTEKYTTIPNVEYAEENISLYEKIVDIFTRAVEERLMTERPLGCLLSGGLDSSLVASVAASLLRKRGEKLKTFSIGMKEGTDIVFAREVARHIGSEHTQFIYEPEEGLSALNEVITVTQTFDITTIRASVGQFLISKRIAQTTDVKVVLNGDGADECQMGYLYFYMAPSPQQAKLDRDRLLQEIHLYDGLRVDRNISHFGLEARVPFLDQNFVNLYYKIAPELIVPTKQRMEKYLIRRAFEVIVPNVLPKSVLWRKKEAFSDGVSSKQKSWYQMVKSHVSSDLYPDFIDSLEGHKTARPIQELAPYQFAGLQPVCVESQYYRLFHSRRFNGNHAIFSHYWLPSWANTNQPSARILKVYEESDKN